MDQPIRPAHQKLYATGVGLIFGLARVVAGLLWEFLSRPAPRGLSFFIVSFLVRSESPVSLPPAHRDRGGRRAQKRSSMARVSASPKVVPLTASSTTAHLGRACRDDEVEGSPQIGAQRDRATSIYSAGAETPGP